MKPVYLIRQAVAAAAISLIVASANAQQLAHGFMFGVVRSEGEPVPEAKITVEKVDTGMTRTVIASANGAYRVPRLPGGTYDVLVSTSNLRYLLETVVVAIGQGTRRDFEMSESDIGVHSQRAREQLEDVLVSTPPQPDIQGTFGEIHSVYSADEIGQLPIPRDVNAVANMAPGTVIGHSRYSSERNPLGRFRTTEFGLISIHGASIAENVYYVDGMNVSNLSNGLGASVLPFEFYDQVQMVTGGLRAEFGRTTGGMVNAVTKSGTKDWRVRFGYYNEPGELRGSRPDVMDARLPSRFLSVFSLDERDSQEGFVSVSGPIIPDRLLVYAIFQDRKSRVKNYEAGRRSVGSLHIDTNEDPFLGAKLSLEINQNHSLDFTYFSDEHRIKRDTHRWDERTEEVIGFRSSVNIDRGGENYIARYTGTVSDKLSISILSGRNNYDYTNHNDADSRCPVVLDYRDQGDASETGCWVNFIRSRGNDTRDAIRVDGEYLVSDTHLLRFGVDREDNSTDDIYGLSGPNFDYFGYYSVDSGDLLPNGGVVPDGVTEVVDHTVFRVGGEYGATSLSVYIEDEWLVSESVNVRLGLRNERFVVDNSEGDTFLRMDDQWAPRIAVAWDLGGTESNRGIVAGGFSRYHLPMPTSISRVLARNRLHTESWHTLAGPINEDGSVELGPQIGLSVVYADGSTRRSSEIVDASTKPMFQDEYTLGYSREFPSEISAGVDYTFRRLGRVIEDISLSALLETGWREYRSHYVVTNPGTDVTVDIDMDLDGIAETVTFAAEELGFPTPVRKYHALEFYFDKHMDTTLYLRGSYTWSHSYGNHEGLSRTDLSFGSTLSGVTYQWDFLGLLDGAYGDLPNDRRHTVKVFGAWKFHEYLQCSFALGWQDGRPRNAWGRHPTDRYARFYGSASFYENGELSPRGALGRTDSVTTLDVGMRYKQASSLGTITVTLDVFNLLDLDAVVDYYDTSDSWRRRPDPNFGAPAWYQNSRSVRLGLVYDLRPRGR